jgi:UDP-glucose 4-epimerase
LHISLRYFNAAGADPDGELGEDHNPERHLLPLVLDTASGRGEAIIVFGTEYNTPDGTCIRDYIHVSDLADAHAKGRLRPPIRSYRRRGSTAICGINSIFAYRYAANPA